LAVRLADDVALILENRADRQPVFGLPRAVRDEGLGGELGKRDDAVGVAVCAERADEQVAAWRVEKAG